MTVGPATTVYRSALHGKTLDPQRWDPLAWSLQSKVAREDAPIDTTAKPFGVIVFSHGSVNDPLNEATLLEQIAGAALVIEAAPEQLDLKRELFGRVGALCPAPAVIASNTSSLPIAARLGGT